MVRPVIPYVFITLEDEHGVVNLVVFQNIFDKYRKEIMQAKLLMVEGMKDLFVPMIDRFNGSRED